MKKFILCSFATMLALTYVPTQVIASTNSFQTEIPGDSTSQRLVLTNRLEEINNVDKSTLTHNEKKELRKEERAIKETLNDGYGGVYISVGALIIIILLLIIIF